jgi:ribosomal protein S6--L-glutamate ligase
MARPGEFRSNIHRGGEGIPIDLKDSYKRIAVQAAKSVGLSIAGVDILESLTGPKIIEINSSPGFEGIERATGLNVAKMMVQHVVQVGRSRSGAYKRSRNKK